jgi:uncharacterized protein (TIGR03437 family)
VESRSPRLLAPEELAGRPGTALRFEVLAPEALTVLATGLPPGSAFDERRSFKWVPTPADLGSHVITFTAIDAQGASTVRPVTLDVDSDAPLLTALRNHAGGAACSSGARTLLTGRFPSEGNEEIHVIVNGAAARVLSQTVNRIEFLCPALPAGVALDIAVEIASSRSNVLSSIMQETAPAILTVEGSPEGHALALRSNAAELAALPNFRFPARPAQSGELVSVHATGFECSTARQLRIQVGGRNAAIDSIGPFAQADGICVIAFRVPDDIAGDSVPLELDAIRTDGSVVASNTAAIAVAYSGRL